jgi:hypothetical protein
MNTPPNFYELLLMIKQRPGAFLGEKSAQKLKIFLDGFEYAMIISQKDYYIKSYTEFKEWFEKKYNIQSVESWYDYLSHDYDDIKSFDVFFIEIEEFYKKNIKIY